MDNERQYIMHNIMDKIDKNKPFRLFDTQAYRIEPQIDNIARWVEKQGGCTQSQQYHDFKEPERADKAWNALFVYQRKELFFIYIY